MPIERIPEDELEHLITPYFKHITVENVPQSELQGQPVMEIKEVVEIRFAADKNYSPILPVDSMYKKDGHRVITYAERWPEQYAQFLSGASQETSGTPLEKLVEYGITPSQLSLLRALKVYNVEALDSITGPNLKNLGMMANDLKRMATDFMADRSKGSATQRELDALRAEIAALKAGNPLPVDEKAELDALPSGYEAMADEELRKAMYERTGKTPGPGRPPNREFVIQTLRDLDAQAA